MAVGLVLRFAHLDRQVFWHDEVYTSLRVAGYQGPVVQEEVLDRPDLTAADLLQYQTLPDQPSLADTWASLVDHPEHPPLYYVLAHGWGRLFGASVGGYRAIAAMFGAIALLAMFWVGRQLFPLSPPVAWVATALMALSPVQMIYSQEAREYSLWTIGLLLAHGTLVRALRLGTWPAWLLYGLTLGLAWYGSLVTGLLGLSHLAVMVISQRQRRPWVGFVAAQGLGLGLFLPWIWVIVRQWSRLTTVTAWTGEPQDFGLLGKLWGLHYSAAVVDFNAPLAHPFTIFGPALVLALVGVALGHVARHYPRLTAVFLGCGLLVPPLVLIGSDILRTGQISSNTRYFLPSLVLIPLTIAPLIVGGLTALERRARALGAALLALLLTLGLASGLANQQASTWWNKSLSYHNRYIADYLNQASAPVVIVERTGISLGEAISLSHYLRPDTPVWLLRDRTLPTGAALQAALQPRPQASVFLFKPTPALLETLPPGWQIAPAADTPLFEPVHLVQITPLQAALSL